MSDISNKYTSVPFTVIVKEGVYTLNSVYIEHLGGRTYLKGFGPNIKDEIVVEGEYHMLIRMIEEISRDLKINIPKNAHSIIDLRVFDLAKKQNCHIVSED